MRIGYGYDVHRLIPRRKLILGGVEIPNDTGLEGHSDADVIIHAIIDAILGALARGDIGQHFPDSNPEYKNINSRTLLKKISNLMYESGMKIENVDTTICAEAPKLAPYLDEMRNNLADDLKTCIGRISIKATTEEGLGISGGKKGISATAVVLLKPADQ
jgi:2-C-methyl-D-erythritol 2,4-cyclodiphosphate synthase